MNHYGLKAEKKLLILAKYTYKFWLIHYDEYYTEQARISMLYQYLRVRSARQYPNKQTKATNT